MATEAGSSSASVVHVIPRIDCPKCKIKVIKCKSKAGDAYYKCPNHFPNDSTCPYYWYEDKYLDYLRANHSELLVGFKDGGPQGQVDAPSVLGSPAVLGGTGQNSDNLVEMMEMKLQIADLKLEIANMKMEMKDLKNAGWNKPRCPVL